MTAFRGTPPDYGCGEMASRTAALRPDIGLTEAQVEEVRRLRKRRAEAPEIAEELGVEQEAVERALLAMRTPQPNPTRGTLNITREARAFILREQQNGEPLWATTDRLIAEVIEGRKRT